MPYELTQAAQLRDAKSYMHGEVEYLGQVADRCLFMNNAHATNKQFMSHSVHTALDDITSLQVEFPNVYDVNTTFAETQGGNQLSTKFDIEYPIGTIAAVGAFAGGPVGVTTGFSIRSLPVAVVIPKGAQFAINEYAVGSTFGIFCNELNTAIGDRVNFGASVTDFVGTANWTGASAGAMRRPLSILATTRRRSALIIGDSIAAGSSGETLDTSGQAGIIPRAIGTRMAYVNIARASSKASDFVANSTFKRTLSDRVTDIILEHQTNDAASGATSAAIIASLEAIRDMFPTKRIWLTTAIPRVNGTYVDQAGQTPIASEAVRVAVNEYKRNGRSRGFTGCIDVADLLEVGRNLGKFKTSDGVARSGDGTHPNLTGYAEGSAPGAWSAFFAQQY